MQTSVAKVSTVANPGIRFLVGRGHVLLSGNSWPSRTECSPISLSSGAVKDSPSGSVRRPSAVSPGPPWMLLRIFKNAVEAAGEQQTAEHWSLSRRQYRRLSSRSEAEHSALIGVKIQKGKRAKPAPPPRRPLNGATLASICEFGPV